MNRKRLLKGSFFLLLCIVVKGYPYIRYIKVWENAKGCTIYGCGDDHRYHSSYVSHAALLRNLALKSHKECPFFIVEDYKGYQGSEPEILHFIENTQSVGSLDGLYFYFARAKHKTANVEWRFARMASLSQILDNEEKKTKELVDPWNDEQNCNSHGLSELDKVLMSNGYQVSGSNVVQEYDDAIDKVRCLSNLSKFKSYRDELIARVSMHRPAFFDQLRNRTESLVRLFYSHIEHSSRLSLAKDLFFFDAELLDAYVLNHIVNEQGRRNIYVCLGYQHIHDIGIQLEELLGFKRKFTVGIDPEDTNAIDSSVCPLTQQQLEVLTDSEVKE